MSNTNQASYFTGPQGAHGSVNVLGSMLGISTSAVIKTPPLRDPTIKASTFFKSDVVYSTVIDFHVSIFQEVYPEFSDDIGSVNISNFNLGSNDSFLAFSTIEVKDAYDKWFSNYSKMFGSENLAKANYFPTLTQQTDLSIIAAKHDKTAIDTSYITVPNTSITSDSGYINFPRQFYTELKDEWAWIVTNCENPVSVLKGPYTYYWVFTNSDDAVRFKLSQK
jgi:hypothetical protein